MNKFVAINPIPSTLPSKVERMRGRRWVETRKRVLREKPLCEACLKEGRVSLAKEVDHIVPLDHGGTHDRANLQGLCLDCHKTKTQAEQGNSFTPRVAVDSSGYPQDESHHWSRA